MTVIIQKALEVLISDGGLRAYVTDAVEHGNLEALRAHLSRRQIAYTIPSTQHVSGGIIDELDD